MFEPSAEELSEAQDRFGLHELAVEDAQSFHLRPKTEQYADGIYFVVLLTVLSCLVPWLPGTLPTATRLGM